MFQPTSINEFFSHGWKQESKVMTTSDKHKESWVKSLTSLLGFPTRSFSRLSFGLWAQCLCTALPVGHVRPARENNTPNLEIQGHSLSLTPTPQHKHNGVCGGGCKRRRCSDNMTSMQHPCISMNSRHSNICSEVPVNIEVPLTKFSNNDLRLLWNVSHISVTSLCKQFCFISTSVEKYLKSLGVSTKSMTVNNVAGDKRTYLGKITFIWIEKVHASLPSYVGWNTLWCHTCHIAHIA